MLTGSSSNRWFVKITSAASALGEDQAGRIAFFFNGMTSAPFAGALFPAGGSAVRTKIGRK